MTTAQPLFAPRTGIPEAFANRVALSRKEVAETLGCSEALVDSLIADGRLRTSMLRKIVRIVASDVWALMGIRAEEESSLSPESQAFLERMGA